MQTDRVLDQPRLIALLLADWANQTDDGKTNLTGVFDRLIVDVESDPITAPDVDPLLKTPNPAHGSMACSQWQCV